MKEKDDIKDWADFMFLLSLARGQKIERLEKIQTATVEACAEAWLGVPYEEER